MICSWYGKCEHCLNFHIPAGQESCLVCANLKIDLRPPGEGGFSVEGGEGRMDNPVTHRELEQFRDLMEAENEQLKQENDRQNHRIEILEQTVREISILTASVRELATSMKSMQEEQEKQGKRLETIEGRDGEKWRKMLSYIGTAILGAVLAIVFAKIGL